MPSRAERTVGCMSRWICMIRLHRHIGVVALMGPISVTAPTGCCCCCVVVADDVVLAVTEVVTDDDDDVLTTAQRHQRT